MLTMRIGSILRMTARIYSFPLPRLLSAIYRKGIRLISKSQPPYNLIILVNQLGSWAKASFQTGGTTGTPKRVVHLQSSISSPVAALSSRVGESSFSFVNCLPLNHVGGWMQVERALRTKGKVFFALTRI